MGNSKGNFNKAMYDMFGVGNDSEPNAAAAPAAQIKEPAARPAPAPVPPVQPSVSSAAAAVLTAAPRAATTYLAPGTSMEGSLKAKGDVEIAGDFKGDVIASGNVIVRSAIKGNITAANLQVVSCSMIGDARIVGSVLIDEKSSVEGNIYSKELVSAGKIKGDVHTASNTTFQQNAHVEGNITTGTMIMERGAVISGSLAMGDGRNKNNNNAEDPKPAAAAGAAAPRAAGTSGAVPHAAGTAPHAVGTVHTAGLAGAASDGNRAAALKAGEVEAGTPHEVTPAPVLPRNREPEHNSGF